MELYKTVRKQAEAVQVIDTIAVYSARFPCGVTCRKRMLFLAEIREKYQRRDT